MKSVHIYDNISLNATSMNDKFLRTKLLSGSKQTFCIQKPSSENLAVFETKCKNIVKPDRAQLKIAHTRLA